MRSPSPLGHTVYKVISITWKALRSKSYAAQSGVMEFDRDSFGQAPFVEGGPSAAHPRVPQIDPIQVPEFSQSGTGFPIEGRIKWPVPTGTGYFPGALADERPSEAGSASTCGLGRSFTWKIGGQEQGLLHTQYAFGGQLPYVRVRRLGGGGATSVDAVKFGRYGQRLYARKLIKLRPEQPQSIERITNEVKIISRLRHAHIVTILASYEQHSADGHISSFGIIMDPVAEGDLTKFLLDNPILTYALELKLRRWCICLVNGLAYMHEQDIRHKDIKPGNILVLGDRIYFTDFELARDFFGEDTTETEGDTLKTRMYCAPEVEAGALRGHSAADVFSLGCVLSRIVTTLFGLPLSAFDDFRCNGSTRAYHANTDKTLRWLLFLLATLDEKCGRSTGSKFPQPPRHSPTAELPYTDRLADEYILLDWCFDTLQPDPRLRISASRLRLQASTIDALIECECRTPQPYTRAKPYPKTASRISDIRKEDALNLRFPVSWNTFNHLYRSRQGDYWT
ncbi:hypothetical protein GP486_004927 [Trichoglossum hirsutum]|uniref:Protein kinase domain-containing protein n=1 Tax=Trichoglossum hirsutum TaxID=265104 RepID=A0A9P8LA89_9PEZI|nr:hypothetical protein GP486_004927 [Trichoglossum hirsutum]